MIKYTIVCICLLLNGSVTLASDLFRIIGGSNTTIEAHPWMASIQSEYPWHVCGGSIIAPTKILTTGHCLYQSQHMKREVLVGSTFLYGKNSGLRYPLSKILIHPLYDDTTLDYDIAIITTEKPFIFSDKVKAIQLPDEGNELSAGTTVTVSGWGIIYPGAYYGPDVPYSVEVNIMDWNECRQKLGMMALFNQRMFCAGVPEGGKDGCKGDSGGPLEFNSILYGISSWGIGCGRAKYPGVYTNITVFRSWIRENAGV